MNAKQRNQNRRTCRDLKRKNKLTNNVCENCGEKGAHWIVAEGTVLLPFSRDGGFWTCSKLYGPDGRRLPGV